MKNGLINKPDFQVISNQLQDFLILFSIARSQLLCKQPAFDEISPLVNSDAIYCYHCNL